MSTNKELKLEIIDIRRLSIHERERVQNREKGEYLQCEIFLVCTYVHIMHNTFLKDTVIVLSRIWFLIYTF